MQQELNVIEILHQSDEWVLTAVQAGKPNMKNLRSHHHLKRELEDHVTSPYCHGMVLVYYRGGEAHPIMVGAMCIILWGCLGSQNKGTSEDARSYVRI